MINDENEADKSRYVFNKGGMIAVVDGPDGRPHLPVEAYGIDCCEAPDFEFEGIRYHAVPFDDDSHKARMRFTGLRELSSEMEASEYRAACKGMELAWWAANTRFCGRCGAAMTKASGISRKCESCGREQFPQLSPAVIVLITKGDEALLVHARTFKRPFFGLVAGFVETGESIEEAVVREVEEETSLRIANLRYWGSQPWPYPSNLMLGFRAEYAGGELRFADDELSEGGFFTRENHPEIPSPPSIARAMIDEWIAEG